MLNQFSAAGGLRSAILGVPLLYFVASSLPAQSLQITSPSNSPCRAPG